MPLFVAAVKILHQLADLVDRMQDTDFNRPSALLNGSTIGQHVRHTLEFFVCLEAGCSTGVVCYDKRDHNTLMENERAVALAAIQKSAEFVATLTDDKPLKLEAGYSPDEESYAVVETNLFRELMYNIEHAVHHMAIIRIAIGEVAPAVLLAPDFGIAASTLRKNRATQSAEA